MPLRNVFLSSISYHRRYVIKISIGYLHRVKEVDVSQWHLAIWTNVDSGWCFANINFTKNISLIESADLALLDAKIQQLTVWYEPPTQNPPKSTRSCIYTVYR